MEEREENASGNYCAGCGSPIPSGLVTCSECSRARIPNRRRVKKNNAASSDHLSVMRAPDDAVRKAMGHGTLTRDQGELLLRLISETRLLDFSMKSALVSLIRAIANEGGAQKREERVHDLIGFLTLVMSSEDTAQEVLIAFRLK